MPSQEDPRSEPTPDEDVFPCPEAQAAAGKVWNWEGGSGFTAYKLNPAITGISVVLIWSFIIVAMSMPEYMLKALDEAAFMWLNEVWCWLYILSQNLWLGALIWILLIPKYGNLLLGRPGDPPSYTFATWFSLLFSAGIAVGLFYYSIAEPLWHYKGHDDPRFHSRVKGYGNTNEDAIHAMMVTWFHWGVHGWIAYTTMGAVLAITVHRRGFPMAIRYVFYPLIGTRTYGIIGDMIDIFSIITTICGVHVIGPWLHAAK